LPAATEPSSRTSGHPVVQSDKAVDITAVEGFLYLTVQVRTILPSHMRHNQPASADWQIWGGTCIAVRSSRAGDVGAPLDGCPLERR
jgi:hypothetical protein